MTLRRAKPLRGGCAWGTACWHAGLDVTDQHAIDEQRDEIAGTFGSLAVLVNNAAILYDTWQKASDANLALGGRASGRWTDRRFGP